MIEYEQLSKGAKALLIDLLSPVSNNGWNGSKYSASEYGELLLAHCTEASEGEFGPLLSVTTIGIAYYERALLDKQRAQQMSHCCQ